MSTHTLTHIRILHTPFAFHRSEPKGAPITGCALQCGSQHTPKQPWIARSLAWLPVRCFAHATGHPSFCTHTHEYLAFAHIYWFDVKKQLVDCLLCATKPAKCSRWRHCGRTEVWLWPLKSAHCTLCRVFVAGTARLTVLMIVIMSSFTSNNQNTYNYWLNAVALIIFYNQVFSEQI